MSSKFDSISTAYPIKNSILFDTMAAGKESSKSNVSKTKATVTKRKLATKTAAAENPMKRTRTETATATEATCSYFPEEIWERIFKFLNDDDNIFNILRPNGDLDFSHHHRCFRSISLVSKQFLSITNRLRFSVTISEKTIPFLHRLFYRFPNVTSHNITLSSQDRNRESNLGELLTQISTFPLDLKSLTLYQPIRLPANELQALSKKMKNLTSLNCYQMRFINKNDLFFIADCFPLLEELILTDNGFFRNCVIDRNDQFLALPKLRKIALTHNIVGKHSVKNLCKNCDLLQEVKVVGGCCARFSYGTCPRPKSRRRKYQ